MGKNEKEPRPYRGVIDEIREQQHKTKDMSLKGKWQYFWDYYKVHTITAVVVILLGGTLIHDILSAKDYAFYGIMLNSIGLSAESMETAFSEYAGIDLETYDCFIDTSSTLSYSTPSEYDMATMQKMVAQVQGHDLDAVVFDSQVFNNYANTEMFADLSEVLPPEEFQKHKDRFYYIDYAPIAKANEDSDYENEAMISSDEGAAASLEDILAEAETHRHPENMEQPVPVGIYMEESPFIQKTGSYGQAQPVFGFIINTQRPETALKYLAFLWDETVDFESMKKNDLFME